MKSILIIDASNLMHRAHHGFGNSAARTLDASGADVTGLNGFLRMVTRQIRTQNIGAIAFVLDPTGDDKCTWRNKVVPTYKEGRSETDPELKAQLNRLPAMLTHLGLPVLSLHNAEADDAIKDIVDALAPHPTLGAVVMSADKDLFQTLDPDGRIQLVRGGPDNVTAADVEAKYGIPAARWVEYSALVGEGADNLPGITGIGPKKAVALIEAFDSCDDMFEADNLDGVVGKAAATKVRDGEFSYHCCKLLGELGTGTVIDLAKFKTAAIDTDALVANAPEWMSDEAQALATALGR